MKQSVKTIVDSIEKEISKIVYEYADGGEINTEWDFEFGNFVFDLSVEQVNDKYIDPWDSEEYNYNLEVKSVTVTNENSKVLTNLSTEVFNQLETTYINY